MERIFLLEDDEALGRGIALALQTPDRAVAQAATLAQARALLQGQDFALLILDVNLPDGSGLDLVRDLRAAAALGVWDRLRTRRLMARLDDMLTAALEGRFTDTHFDESRLSALESRLAQYLAAADTSARRQKKAWPWRCKLPPAPPGSTPNGPRKPCATCWTTR